ncbi:hypothetical protein DSO57_1017774 [Entomophthora muscae]|uniref:Uncharacterized protein n=1 Tax=Entomophthora muscae TaxID=34485 RepID=A0ACC2S6D5_9FUNG|nr:hypothetical protein DSO57_1017774 [Entomophthora muscae]
MAQCALYNPRDLAQPINSSGATCNSMHMASSESSNLDEPITPDGTMEVDSANMLINNCNLTGPITPNNAMEVDSLNALINKCNSNEPIKPLDAMKTDTPNVLSNNCDSDGPIRPGAAGAKFAHPDQAGCPTPGHPIRSHDAKKTNAPNVLSNYYLVELAQNLLILTKLFVLPIANQSNPAIPQKQIVATEFPASPANVSYDTQGALNGSPLDVSNVMS